MKKIVCLFFILSCYFPLCYGKNPKNKSEMYRHLVRRERRKSHGGVVEQDDFGYMPKQTAYRN